jgi:hypothetical protein
VFCGYCFGLNFLAMVNPTTADRHPDESQGPRAQALARSERRSPSERYASDGAHPLAFALMDPDFRQDDGNVKFAPDGN